MGCTELNDVFLPTLRFPWSTRCHVGVASIERETTDWATRYRLVSGEREWAALRNAKFGHFSARCYPDADREVSQIDADFFTWFFLFDDAYVDRVEPGSPHVLPAITAALDVLDSGRSRNAEIVEANAFADVCRRLRGRATHAQFQRFAQAMRLYLNSLTFLVLMNTRDQPPTMAEYEAVRLYSGGVQCVQALIDVGRPTPLADEEYNHSDVRRLARCMGNAVTWLNDLHGLDVEADQPGVCWSMPLVYAAHGHTLQEGVDYTVRRIAAEITEFEAVAEIIEPTASSELHYFIDGLRLGMAGYQEWVEFDTGRYSS
jgi:terpene synthase-like protein